MLTLPITIRQIALPVDVKRVSDLKTGDWWYSQLEGEPGSVDDEGYRKWYNRLECEKTLSDYYLQNNKPNRPPIIVVLPGNYAFCVDDMCYSNDKGGYYGGWTVTGDPSQGTLTVSPSINISGTYHGWLQNNVIAQECEGRTYNDDGSLCRS